jgi:hypothetical protein
VRGLTLAALLVIAVVAALVVGFRHGSKPPEVRPVPHASTPAAEARNLEAWLRSYTS